MSLYRPSRLFVTAAQKEFEPTIKNTPALPVVDYSLLGQSAPKLVAGAGSALPAADAVVITWAGAEWAALQHVFCSGSATMPYSERSTSNWSGWTKYSDGLPAGGPSDWTFWGLWRLVEMGGNKVLLFKSNTHLDWPGESYLAQLIQLLIAQVKPRLIFSIGTAGGAKTGDHVGTVRAVSSGTLYEKGAAPSAWPVYSNAWKANDSLLTNPNFAKLLLPIPTTTADLDSLVTQFNSYYKTKYSLAELDPDGLNKGDAAPNIVDQTGGAATLLTTSTFVVGTNGGQYQEYACIEMDDAVIGQVCAAAGTAFGFVRNVSDPVQNAAMAANVQQSWGSAIYDSYGFYTSYNGALAAWAMLAAGF